MEGAGIFGTERFNNNSDIAWGGDEIKWWMCCRRRSSEVFERDDWGVVFFVTAASWLTVGKSK